MKECRRSLSQLKGAGMAGKMKLNDYQGIPLIQDESGKIEGSIEIEPPKVYARRWYCLLIYSLLCFCFGYGYIGIGAIAHAFEVAYDWTNAEVAVTNLWIPAMFLVSCWFSSWLLDTKGARLAFLYATAMLILSSVIKAGSVMSSHTKFWYHFSQLFMGLTAPAINGGAASFSSTWFPAHQRTLATACATISSFIGVGVGSIIGPLIVPVRHPANLNASAISNAVNNITSQGLPQYKLEMRHDVEVLLYSQLGLPVAVFIVMLIYFPKEPPTPPSFSQFSEKENFIQGAKTLFKKPMFCLLTFIDSMTSGLLFGFSSLINVNLYAAGVPNDQMLSGWISLFSLASSVIFSIILSGLVDKFTKYVKYIILTCVVIAFVCFTWFAFILQGWLSVDEGSLLTSSIVGITMLMSLVPVIYELVCDITFPIGEALTGGVKNIFSNLITLGFLLLFLKPNIGTSWMNWVMAGASGLCIPLILLYQPAARRE